MTANLQDVNAWLDSLTLERLRDLVSEAEVSVTGFASFLRRAKVAADGDVTTLRTEVDSVLGAGPENPYGIRTYLADAAPALELLETMAQRPTLDVLHIQEQAVDRMVDQLAEVYDYHHELTYAIEEALIAHRECANALAGELSEIEQRRIGAWLYRLEFEREGFDLDIGLAEYAPALGKAGLEEYRAQIGPVPSNLQECDWSVRHAIGRLAVISGDVDEIVRCHGGDLTRPHDYVRVMRALSEAGCEAEALDYAQRGLGLPYDAHSTTLAERVVADAEANNDLRRVTELRRTDLHGHPRVDAYRALQSAASRSGDWADLEPAAAKRMAEDVPTGWVDILLADSRVDEAWAFAAGSIADRDEERWRRLCAARAVSAPADTLPVYRRLIDDRLQVANRNNYEPAATMLVHMAQAAHASDRAPEYEDYVAQVVATNRRRPRCMDEFRKAGLIC